MSHRPLTNTSSLKIAAAYFTSFLPLDQIFNPRLGMVADFSRRAESFESPGCKEENSKDFFFPVPN